MPQYDCALDAARAEGFDFQLSLEDVAVELPNQWELIKTPRHRAVLATRADGQREIVSVTGSRSKLSQLPEYFEVVDYIVATYNGKITKAARVAVDRIVFEVTVPTNVPGINLGGKIEPFTAKVYIEVNLCNGLSDVIESRFELRVCSNGMAIRGVESRFSIPHVGKMDERLEAAHQGLIHTLDNLPSAATSFEDWASAQVSDFQAEIALVKVLGNYKTWTDAYDRVVDANAGEGREVRNFGKVWDDYRFGPHGRGTVWSVYNALTAHATHRMGRDPQSRFAHFMTPAGRSFERRATETMEALLQVHGLTGFALKELDSN